MNLVNRQSACSEAICYSLGTAFSGVRIKKACSTSGLSSASVGMTVGLPSFALSGSAGVVGVAVMGGIIY